MKYMQQLPINIGSFLIELPNKLPLKGSTDMKA